MDNCVRDYAWGHRRYIPEFLGISNPEANPFAELWMGAHPLASSEINTDSSNEKRGNLRLSEFISQGMDEVLGPEVSKKYGQLPYLFKLLAAGESLSIQAHPAKKMAEEGFRREENAGIPVDAPERNYRDDNHKPEIIMAISPFTAMIGFRNPVDILRSFSFLKEGAPKLNRLLDTFSDVLTQDSSRGLRLFLEGLLTLDSESQKILLDSAAAAVKIPVNGFDPLQLRWTSQLISSFPGDTGALAPLFLNIVELQPGEALYQPPGALHAYLEGFGLELMANSDNVLRGGLTKKHIDVPELMKVLRFETGQPDILKAGNKDEGAISHYKTPTAEFSLGTAEIFPDNPVRISSHRGPMIVLVMEGELILSDGLEKLKLVRGKSVFIPWQSDNLDLSGLGKAAFAGVGG